jgi:hypothetical protein
MSPTIIGILWLGFGGAVLGVLGVLLRRSTRGLALLEYGPLVVAGTAATLAAMGEEPKYALVPAGAAAMWLLLRWDFLRRPMVSWALLVAVSPALALAWANAVTPPMAEPWSEPLILQADYSEVDNGQVRTDAGKVVKVHAPTRAATNEELTPFQFQTRLPNLICLAPPGVDHNCHGWVFTDGRYWVNSVEVEPILQDNGYALVYQPRPGDLIVYRNHDKKVVHTGVVRAADDLGVLIESKWDKRGRYIHTPDNQDYAVHFEYYRSPRSGHILHGITPRPGVAPSAPPPAQPVATE